MTDESSVISGANITDHHIAMVRDDVIIETEVYTCINLARYIRQTITVHYNIIILSIHTKYRKYRIYIHI